MTLVILIISVVLLLMLRVPVVFALLLPSLAYFAFLGGPGSMSAVVPQAVAGLNSFPLLAVPMFVMMGMVANETGVTERLFNFAEALLGRVRGSLGYVNILVSFGFSWMSGSAIADSAGLGRLEVPEMIRRGYDEGFSTGITASSGIIGPIMPPSIPAVLYAVAAGTSLGGLLIAGIIPAFLLVVALSIAVYLYARKRPELRLDPVPLGKKLRTGAAAVPAMLAPVILIGGILGGVFTPTEAAAFAVVYLLLLSLLQRTLSPRKFYQVLLGTAKTVGMILFIVSVAAVFGRIVTRERGPQLLADAMLSISENPLVFLLIVNVLALLVGMILEPASAILILVPVLLPVAKIFEISPLHFGSVIILNLMIGLLTPPIGLILYVISAVTNIPVSRVMRGTAPFLIPLIIVLLLVTYIPQLTLYLPGLMGL
jgi:tripartite ATP-independent transporter DctM subunit